MKYFDYNPQNQGDAFFKANGFVMCNKCCFDAVNSDNSNSSNVKSLNSKNSSLLLKNALLLLL